MYPEVIHFLFLFLSIISPISSIEFVFNSNFNSSNLLTFGNSSIDSSTSVLALTNDTTFNIGRAFYPLKIPTKPTNSATLTLPFSTSFIFSISPVKNFLPGHGFAFVFFPSAGVEGANSAQHLGLFNFTNDGDPNNHVFGVEFDTFMNEEFNDVNDNHVGVDVNSLTSIAQQEAGFWVNEVKFKTLVLNNGENYQVWIDYLDSRVNITMAKAGELRPIKPLISESVNLSNVFLDEMYVGFCAATGRLVQSHRILAWSFSNTNFSISDALITKNLPSFVASEDSVLKSKGFIIGISVACVMIIAIGVAIFVFVVFRKRRESKMKKEEELEDWELEYWPHRIDYEQIVIATKGFAEENVIGYGGNGKVYKGVLDGKNEVAVKRISHQATREFIAEISSLGRLKHRNLVAIRGWSKQDKKSLILLYDYMVNGSLDKKIFTLNWAERVKILKDVANGVLYLHEGWEAKVLHRDIKSSNVLLDKDMNARLGDFGLARVHHHGELASTTQVVGTAGYMAPEVVRTGRASTQTDVYSFGVLVLEVVCGKRPVEDGKPNSGLVDFVWRSMERGEVMEVLDDRVREKGGYSNEEVERMIGLGLACANYDPKLRPKMRQIVKFLERGNEGNGFEGEEMEANLLQGIRRSRVWFTRQSQNYRDLAYPSLTELLPIVSSSMSLSGSDIISDGR